MGIKKVSKPESDKENTDEKNTSMKNAKKDTIGEKNINNKKGGEKSANDKESNIENVKKKNVDKENIDKESVNKSDIDLKGIEKKDTGKKIADAKSVGDKGDKKGASTKDSKVKKSEESDTGKKNILKRIFKWPFSKLKPKAEIKIKAKTKAKKSNLKKINFKNINIKKVVSDCGEFWFRHYRVIFALLFFLTFIAGILFWYQKLYNSQWSYEKKQQYTASQKVEVNFREDKFQDVVKAIESRKSAYEDKFKTLNSIFQLIEENNDE
ncbi:hypothetical protein BMS3Abin15_00314 [bacterium BMS3Abin15]|nr:hypothetical protein BMS3Abin15_00314 [bacterium BMS3Abin15]HDH07575.1 hypothetical protein [Candidatus Moranbacteria bacterium]HDL75032.1 hypothetical protein [bacterium]